MADIINDEEDNSVDQSDIPLGDGIILDNDYYYNLYSTVVYKHPFFSYVLEPPEQFTIKPTFSEIYPYLIPKYTYHDKYPQNCITPQDFNEKSIQVGFCHWVQRHSPEEVGPFLDYQFEGYIARTAPNEDPSAFLEYVISTVETYNDSANYYNRWTSCDYERFKAMGKWLRSHPSWKEPFDQRLRNWVSLNASFRERAVTEYNQEQRQASEVNLAREKEAIAKAQDDLAAQQLEDRKAVVKKRLRFLSGYRSAGRKIMGQEDFDLLVEYTFKMVETEEVPKIVMPITIVEVPMGYLRYTYYLIHKELYGIKPKRKYFIDFLYAVFPSHFNEESLQWSTTYTKFSDEPKSYYADVEKWGKIGKL